MTEQCIVIDSRKDRTTNRQAFLLSDPIRNLSSLSLEMLLIRGAGDCMPYVAIELRHLDASSVHHNSDGKIITCVAVPDCARSSSEWTVCLPTPRAPALVDSPPVFLRSLDVKLSTASDAPLTNTDFVMVLHGIRR